MTTMTTTTLTTLAGKINEHHRQVEAAIRSALKHARKCGAALLQAKSRVEHGKFEAWIACNCEVSPRQCRNYMTLAGNWGRIVELSQRKRASDLGLESLSIRAALRLLSEDSGFRKYTNALCPSCGERMVYTSTRYFTCAACWDCRLYENPKATVTAGNRWQPVPPKGPIERGKRCRDDFRQLADPNEQAEVALSILSMLDDESGAEVARLLCQARLTPTRRRAAEVLAKLRGREAGD